ncbi:hypothetical protein [Lysobacter gummosus]|uniref:hypothetical protein n=1 Tax=Lysobacter gummosus TaxID=262324 RepID=UPI00363C64FF
MRRGGCARRTESGQARAADISTIIFNPLDAALSAVLSRHRLRAFKSSARKPAVPDDRRERTLAPWLRPSARHRRHWKE